MDDAPQLEAEAISKRFGGIVALDQMHFAAAAGEVHAILGENGAGKCTFIRILAGAVRADEGRVTAARQAVPAALAGRCARRPASPPSSRSCRSFPT